MELDLHQLLKLPLLLPGEHKGELLKRETTVQERGGMLLLNTGIKKSINGFDPHEVASNDEFPVDPRAVRVRWSVEPLELIF